MSSSGTGDIKGNDSVEGLREQGVEGGKEDYDDEEDGGEALQDRGERRSSLSSSSPPKLLHLVTPLSGPLCRRDLTSGDE
jgi:hypothetical protein